MWIIGLTGAIGSGKSTLSNQLRWLGIPVHCADQETHDLLDSNPLIQKQIKNSWPTAFRNGKVNRDLLGDQVLGSYEQLEKLEKILYPHLAKAQFRFLKKHQKLKTSVVAIDVPLLFEVGLDSYCQFVFLAEVPYFLRKQRVLKRKHMTEEKFEALESHQLNQSVRRKMADVIIPTGLGKGSSLKRIKEILHILSQKKVHAWQGKWPTTLQKEPNDKRNRLRYRNNWI
jgi:dephospho-CoA kinase